MLLRFSHVKFETYCMCSTIGRLGWATLCAGWALLLFEAVSDVALEEVTAVNLHVMFVSLSSILTGGLLVVVGTLNRVMARFGDDYSPRDGSSTAAHHKMRVAADDDGERFNRAYVDRDY